MIKIDDIYTIIDKILAELKLTDKLIVTANTGFVHNQYFLFVDIEKTQKQIHEQSNHLKLHMLVRPKV